MAVLTSTHNLCFEQKYEKYLNFSSENFHFLVVKFSIYLNRRVLVMSYGIHKFYNYIVGVSKAVPIRFMHSFLLFMCCFMMSFRVNLTLRLCSVIVTSSEYPHTSRKHAYIILNLLNPTFQMVKLGFTGVYIIFSYFC